MAKSAPARGRKKHRSALVLINRKSGTVRSRGAQQVEALVRDALSSTFTQLDVELFDGDIIPALAKAIKTRNHDVVVAGGGDGTISSAAGALLGSDLTMAALPLGTMNLFVQALGFSARLEEALTQLAVARETSVDVGLANDLVFLHQVSFGLQPRMARLRERIGYSSRITKMLAALRAFLVLAARPRMVKVIVQDEGPPRKVKTPLLIVSNNPLGGNGSAALPQSLDGGVLGFYALEQFTLSTLLRLARDYLANRVHESPAVDARTTKNVTIFTQRRRLRGKRAPRGLLASMDGEVLLLEAPVSIKIKPKSLKVLAAAQPAA